MTDRAATAADAIERLSRLLRGLEHETDLAPAQWQALRYLARANRYSRTPGALAQYLAATKGTVSQTVRALERKKLIRRRSDSVDRRVVRLELTASGQTRLTGDPLRILTDAARDIDATLTRELVEVLRRLQLGNDHRAFGQCATCRFFRRDDAVGERGGPHRCGLTREPLNAADSVRICVEHEAA
jgi:DNA-binding MarR family transcriptional regulator